MISERALRKWRKEALVRKQMLTPDEFSGIKAELIDQVLKMTQELLDQHLMQKK